MSKLIKIILAVIVILLVAGGLFLVGPKAEKVVVQDEPLIDITIGDSGSLVGSHIYVAFEKGFFKDEGLNATLDSTYSHGRAMIEGILSGKAHFATGSETPFVHSGLNNENIFIITQTMSIDDHLAIVTDKSKEIDSVKGLKEKKVGVTKGSNGEFYLTLALESVGLSMTDISEVHYPPSKLASAIMNGDVDAISSWYPVHFSAAEKLGDGAVVFDEALYNPFFLIGAEKDYVRKNPDTIEKFLMALNLAQNYIEKNPEEAMRIIADHTNISPKQLSNYLSVDHFDLRLDQALLLTLEEQANWAIENNLTEAKQAPNFLDIIHYDSLEKVIPGSVSMIR
jgi:NitT/TauT family transport system substrate-binding protein